MKRFVFLLMVLGAGILFAQKPATRHHSQMPLDCFKCHICKKPTYEKPCLRVCPDFARKGMVEKHTVNEAPDFLIIDSLSAEYEPVVFSHRRHAEMTEMNGGCESCHHHNPPGKLLACSACHKKSNDDDLMRPKLKAAYHQLCIQCHRRWDIRWQKRSDCIGCHPKREGEISPQLLQARLQLVKKAQSRISVPETFTYKSDYDEGPVVTFHHRAHAARYGRKCTDCHRNESCTQCHGVHQRKEVSHETCENCHSDALENNCAFCHGAKEKPAFDHGEITGWPLNRYHKKLNCVACHKTGKSFTKLNTRCTNCHKNFTAEKFDHSVTGLALSEEHAELECGDCHLNRDFSRKPSCTECHDDYAFPRQKPGRLTRGR